MVPAVSYILPVQRTPSDLVGVRVLDEVRFDSSGFISSGFTNWRIEFRADDEIYSVSECGMFSRPDAPKRRSASAMVVNFVAVDGGGSVAAIDESTEMAVLVVRMGLHWSASYCPSGMTWVSGAPPRDAG